MEELYTLIGSVFAAFFIVIAFLFFILTMAVIVISFGKWIAIPVLTFLFA